MDTTLNKYWGNVDMLAWEHLEIQVETVAKYTNFANDLHQWSPSCCH